MSRPDAVPFLDLAGVNAPFADEFDVAWKGVLTHGRFIGGPEVEAFEAAFAAFCDRDHCVGVANGTDALELILAGLGIGAGDEVVVPTNTFVATAEAVCNVGARPVFVDVVADTLLIDPDAVSAAIGPRTAAVMAVHLFGQTADMDRLLPIVRRAGVALVEDAAQAHGARFDGRRAGGHGVAGSFSFYPGKNLGALGDGGAIVSDDPHLIARVRRLADHGRSEDRRHLHESVGRNSRLDSLQAAALAIKLPSLDTANARRRTVMEHYRSVLPPSTVPLAQHPLSESVHHVAVVRTADRGAATAALDAAAIGWGVHYPVPCHRQPAFARFATGSLPVAEAAAESILSLPMSPTLDPAQIERVAAALAGV